MEEIEVAVVVKFAATLLLVLYPATALAEVKCDTMFPDRCSVELSAGSTTPFQGVLLSSELGIALGQKAMNCDRRTEIEVTRTSSLAFIRRQADRKRFEVDIYAAGAKGRLDGYRDGYAAGVEAATPSWYERPVVVSLATVVVSIGLFFAVKQGITLIERQ